MTTLTPVVSVQRWWGKDYPEGHLCCAEYLSWISSCLSERIVHSFHISPASRTELNLTLLYRSVVECAAAQPNGAPQWLFINIMQVYRELTVLKLSLEAGEVKANSRLEITEMCRKKLGSSVVTRRFQIFSSANKRCSCALHTQLLAVSLGHGRKTSAVTLKNEIVHRALIRLPLIMQNKCTSTES